MASGNANFEIQVMKAGRWVAESVRDTEEEARAVAKKFLANRSCEGARVIRNWMRGDGMMVEAEVFCETRTVTESGQLRISSIEEVPPRCEKTQEYYALPSRMVMNRIFRAYLDQATLTPTELIHNYKELRRLQDKDTLVPSAVDRVAALQTKDTELDPRARREEIFKSIDTMSARARRAEGLKLPKLNGRFHPVVETVTALAERDGDAEYLSLVVLAGDLVEQRSWLGKLERLCSLAAEETDPTSLALLDGVIADVLGANVVQEILGNLPGLGHAICAMLDLADGCMDTSKSEARPIAETLNRLMAEKKLPAARLCLIDRAHRQIRLAAPLYRNDSSREVEAFRMVVARVLTPVGMVCGGDSAEALTTRQTRMVEEGGQTGRRAAMNETLRAMPDRAAGVLYLCDLSHSPYGSEHLEDIEALLHSQTGARSLNEFTQSVQSPKERLQRATNAFLAVGKSALSAAERQRLADRIDILLEQYVVQQQIIEKLDHQDSLLRDRAVRLVQFCGSGVLPDGRALRRARERVLELLRQPNFDGSFIEGITDPQAAAKALRDFHQMLVRAGFAK